MKAVDEYGETLTQLSKFVQRLDESVRSEAFKFLLTQEMGGSSLSGPGVAPPSARRFGSRELAPQELIRNTRRVKLTEKAVVLGFWLETYAGKQTFSSGDLKGAFETAREKAPKNPSDVVAGLEQTGRLMKADKVGGTLHYRLTGTALEEVEGWLASGESK